MGRMSKASLLFFLVLGLSSALGAPTRSRDRGHDVELSPLHQRAISPKRVLEIEEAVPGFSTGNTEFDSGIYYEDFSLDDEVNSRANAGNAEDTGGIGEGTRENEDEDENGGGGGKDDDDDDDNRPRQTDGPSGSNDNRNNTGRGDDDDDDDDDDDGTAGLEGINFAENDGTGACFSAESTVELQNGHRKRMNELSIGDRVRISPTEFSAVFMFTHRVEHIEHIFLTLWVSESTGITLTPGHYLYVNGMLTPARNVHPGDRLKLASGEAASVIRVTSASQKGLYNPQTLHGDIVVDDILASTYTSTVERSMAHALLAPLRAVFAALGFSTYLLDNGVCQQIANLAVKGM